MAGKGNRGFCLDKGLITLTPSEHNFFFFFLGRGVGRGGRESSRLFSFQLFIPLTFLIFHWLYQLSIAIRKTSTLFLPTGG